jgi:hypothetical protein
LILVLAIGLAGYAFLPWLPPEQRTGAALGWGIAVALECVLNLRRAALMRGGASRGNLLSVTAFGFLAKLFLLAAGAVLGSEAGLYSPSAYLLAFLAAIFVGEGIGLTALHRRSSTRSSRPR